MLATTELRPRDLASNPQDTPSTTRIPANSAADYRWPVALLLIIGAILALPFDLVAAQFFMSDPFPGELRSLIHKAEFFGHAYGIMGIVFTIYLLCEHQRKNIPQLLATAFMAGVACDVFKILIHRVRPVDFSFAPGEASFLGLSFLHAESWGQLFASEYHSFPSAHTATAVAFAMALGTMFPRGAKWFLVLAGICAISRFDGGAHYVSDTFVGGLVGYTCGYWMLSKPVTAWFRRQRMEDWTTWPRGMSMLGAGVRTERS